MSLEFLKQMHDKAVAREVTPTTPGQPKIIDGRKWNAAMNYDPSYCDIAFGVLSSGESLNGAAASLGVGLKTLQRWREQFSDFDQACEAGLSASIREWERIGKENLSEKVFQATVWNKLLTSKSEAKDPSRVILNVDSSSNANQVADLVRELEKERL